MSKFTNTRKIITTIIATLLLTGCGSTTETKTPLEVVGTEPKESIVTVLETETTIATEPIVEAEPTEPAQTQFQFGDIIWVVRRCTADEDASVTRCRVVAQSEKFVVVVPMWGPDMDQFRENLTVIAEMPYDEFTESNCLELVLESNCYTDRFEAEAVIENGDV